MSDIQFLILIGVLAVGFWSVIHNAAHGRMQALQLSRIEHTLELIQNLLVAIKDHDKRRSENDNH